MTDKKKDFTIRPECIPPIIRPESESFRQSELRYKKELMDRYDEIYNEYVRLGILSNKSKRDDD